MPTISGPLELPAGLTDQARMIQRILRGEKTLFAELVRPYERGVFIMAHSLLRNEHDAEDAAQETMVQAFTHLDRLNDARKFKSWLFTIALNQARMMRRKAHAHLYESMESLLGDASAARLPREFPDWRKLPSEIVESEESAHELRRAVGGLSAGNRAVFLMRDVDELSSKETAALLGITVTAVKTRLVRARRELRDHLWPLLRGSHLGRRLFRMGQKPW